MNNNSNNTEMKEWGGQQYKKSNVCVRESERHNALDWLRTGNTGREDTHP